MHGTISPCFSFPVLALILFFITSLHALIFLHTTPTTPRRNPISTIANPRVWPLAIATSLQLALLILSLAVDTHTTFLAVTNVCTLIAVALTLAIAVRSLETHTPAPWHTTATSSIAGVALYQAYVSLNMVLAGWTVHGRAYATANAALCTALAASTAWSAMAGRDSSTSDHTQPLLPAAEKGGDGDAPARQRSWWALTGKAIAFVWPKGVGHQLQLVACLLILAIVRVLNLALPLANKHMIDRLSEV